MTRCNAGDELQRWLDQSHGRLASSASRARLRRLDGPPENTKAVLELERANYVATISLWGTGMLDLDVVRTDVRTTSMATHECCDLAEVRRMVDVFFAQFLAGAGL